MGNNLSFVDEVQAARLTGLSIYTLRNWRFLGRGPAYVKFGRAVRYSLEDLRVFADRCRVRVQEELSASRD
jgi:hypothetical protein